MTGCWPPPSPAASSVLYPDAGHGFLFQDSSAFVPRVEQFLQAQG